MQFFLRTNFTNHVKIVSIPCTALQTYLQMLACLLAGNNPFHRKSYPIGYHKIICNGFWPIQPKRYDFRLKISMWLSGSMSCTLSVRGHNVVASSYMCWCLNDWLPTGEPRSLSSAFKFPFSFWFFSYFTTFVSLWNLLSKASVSGCSMGLKSLTFSGQPEFVLICFDWPRTFN